MNQYFKKNVHHIIEVEQGFTDDRDDHGNWTGGEIGAGKLNGTKYGISAAAFPHIDIKKLSKSDAVSLYYKHYWIRSQCPDLPQYIQLIHFDAAVNHGVSRANKLLQKAINGNADDGISVDGKIGQQTLKYVCDASAGDYIAQRALFYSKIVKNDSRKMKYLIGWMNRLVKISKF